MKTDLRSVSLSQQLALVSLRTLVGWHFFYEGYVKLLHPAWSRDGQPLALWTSAGYLKAATGPLAGMFHSIADASWIGSLDILVALLLAVIGTSLLLGLFTQMGCAGALVMLSIFYVSAIPVGLSEAHAEGSYLIVNKNLIELVAVVTLLAFRTGRIAGLDLWWIRSQELVTQETTV
jgi:thiosulfate dehydrogenase [quinone] large subunit